MNYSILVILILIIIIFFYFNKMLYNKNNEHFTELLVVFNNLMNYSNKQVVIKNKDDLKFNKDDINDKDNIIKNAKEKNIEKLFKKNIYIFYKKESNNAFELYFYNYKNQLYLKCKIRNNQFSIIDKNNKTLGSLISNMYQTYKFNLKELYEEDIFYFTFLKNYNTIKIYPENQTYHLYIKKNISYNTKNKHLIYTLSYFEKEIGYIYINKKNYKIELVDKYKNLLNLFGIGLGLIIKMQ